MKIEVIGPGCPFCKTLYRRVEEVITWKRHPGDRAASDRRAANRNDTG